MSLRPEPFPGGEDEPEEDDLGDELYDELDEYDDEYEDDYEDEYDDERSEPLYLKYCFDGAASLDELAGALRGLADDLERRGAEGWRLDSPVDSGWAHLVRDA